jgi:hypothetical protein
MSHSFTMNITSSNKRIFGKDIYEAIVELGTFFMQLYSRTLDKNVLAEMKKEIPLRLSLM